MRIYDYERSADQNPFGHLTRTFKEFPMYKANDGNDKAKPKSAL